MDDVRVSKKKNKLCNWNILNQGEKALVVLGSVSIILGCIIAIVSLSKNPNNEDKTLSLVLIVSGIMTLCYLYRGIFQERPYELIIYVVSVICFLFYVLINMVQTYDPKLDRMQILKMVRVGVSVLVMPITAVLGCLLAYNYNIRGDVIFRQVGGFEQLQEACKNLYVFEALLCLDTQFQISNYLLCLGLEEHELNQAQKVILGLGFPFAFLWIALGFLSMRQEFKIGSVLFILLGVIGPSYNIYLLYEAIDTIINASYSPMLKPVKPIISITFACTVLALVIRVLLIITAIIVYKNFKQGLKSKMSIFGTKDNEESRRLVDHSHNDT